MPIKLFKNTIIEFVFIIDILNIVNTINTNFVLRLIILSITCSALNNLIPNMKLGFSVATFLIPMIFIIFISILSSFIPIIKVSKINAIEELHEL